MHMEIKMNSVRKLGMALDAQLLLTVWR